MQRQGHVADGVRQIETDPATGFARGSRDARKIERLARSELHAGPEHKRNLTAELFQTGFDGLFRHQVLAGVRRELDEVIGTETVP